MTRENKEFISKLYIVVIPIMLQSLVQSALGFLDTLMIGQLGEAEVAAIGGANQFFFFIQLAFFGLNSGGSIFLAQYYGAKNEEGHNLHFHNCRYFRSLGLPLRFFVSFFVHGTVLFR